MMQMDMANAKGGAMPEAHVEAGQQEMSVAVQATFDLE
jgi:hypothetical protein